MIRIAICDNDKETVEKNITKVNECLKEMNKMADIKLYLFAENLEFDIRDGENFDLMIMGVEMQGKSGMDIAKMVKEYSVETLIIFVTSHSEYAVDAYELSVFRYVYEKK